MSDEGAGDARSVADATSVECDRVGARQGAIKGRYARPAFTRRSKDVWDYRNIPDQQILKYRQALDRDLKASHHEMFLCQHDNTRHFHMPVYLCLHNN